MGSELPIILSAKEEKHGAVCHEKTKQGDFTLLWSREIFSKDVTFKMTSEGEQQLDRRVWGMLSQVGEDSTYEYIEGN